MYSLAKTRKCGYMMMIRSKNYVEGTVQRQQQDARSVFVGTHALCFPHYRAAFVTKMNFEWMDPQIVHYSPGEYFHAHHDYLQIQKRDARQRLVRWIHSRVSNEKRHLAIIND
jgi:hypothetical protein